MKLKILSQHFLFAFRAINLYLRTTLFMLYQILLINLCLASIKCNTIHHFQFAFVQMVIHVFPFFHFVALRALNFDVNTIFHVSFKLFIYCLNPTIFKCRAKHRSEFTCIFFVGIYLIMRN